MQWRVSNKFDGVRSERMCEEMIILTRVVSSTFVEKSRSEESISYERGPFLELTVLKNKPCPVSFIEETIQKVGTVLEKKIRFRSGWFCYHRPS